MTFPSLPASARVWTFALDRTLNKGEESALAARIDAFLPTWTSHGRPVHAQSTIVERRAVVVAALIDEREANAGVSGCGIDSMRHAVEGALESVGVPLAGPLSIVARINGDWETLTRSQIRALAESGTFSASTPVLDTTAVVQAELSSDGPVRPASETWIGQAFALSSSTEH